MDESDTDSTSTQWSKVNVNDYQGLFMMVKEQGL